MKALKIGLAILLGIMVVGAADGGPAPKATGNSQTGVSTILGTVTYNNQPFRTQANVQIILYDTSDWVPIAVPPELIHPSEGTFTISGVQPGTYSVFFKSDANGPADYMPFPGDFWGGYGNIQVTGQPQIRVNIPVWKILHLKSPANNNPPGLLVPPPYPVYQSPVTFAWDPVKEASSYFIILQLVKDDFSEVIAFKKETITQNKITVPLPPNKPGQHYQIFLDAQKQTAGYVGRLLITYLRTSTVIWGYNSLYAFKVGGLGPVIK